MTGHAYRGGRVHVVAEQCSTCIFRPGNLMTLHPGRVKQMVDDCLAEQSAIICHQTLEDYGLTTDNAICRGFYDKYDTQPLQVARRLGMIEEDPLMKG